MSELINKRSGRKRNYDYEQKEKEYQEAQSHFAIFGDNKSWDIMWSCINLAVFNTINKDLEHKLDRETIEERAMDITCNIMQTIRNKIAKGLDWKINRVSSFVYLPCLARFKKEWQFEDKVLDESYFTTTNDDGTKTMKEYKDSYFKGGIYYLHGDYYGTDCTESD